MSGSSPFISRPFRFLRLFFEDCWGLPFFLFFFWWVLPSETVHRGEVKLICFRTPTPHRTFVSVDPSLSLHPQSPFPPQLFGGPWGLPCEGGPIHSPPSSSEGLWSRVSTTAVSPVGRHQVSTVFLILFGYCDCQLVLVQEWTHFVPYFSLILPVVFPLLGLDFPENFVFFFENDSK